MPYLDDDETATERALRERDDRDHLADPEPRGDIKTVRLAVEGPLFVSEFITTDEDGATLVIDRHGTSVSPDHADRLEAAAAIHGITLTRK